MKKYAALLAILVMISTPCFAQFEIKGNGTVALGTPCPDEAIVTTANADTITRIKIHGPYGEWGYEYQPLVQEGKTWWYTQYENKLERTEDNGYKEIHLNYEYGLTIFGDTTINDTHYKKVLIGKNNLGVPENEICVAAVREHNRNGYAKNCDFQSNSKINCILGHISRPVNSDDEIYIYDFSTAVGDTTQLLKDMLYTQEPLTCDKIDTLYISKRSLLLFIFSNAIKEVESVGITESETFFLGFFFNPVTVVISTLFQCYPPVLRYVTDPVGEVLYEGLGGLKLWEENGSESKVSAVQSWMEYRDGELLVPITEGVRELVIYNAMGAVVAKYTVPAGESTISLSSLPKGIYIAQLQGAPSYKFVK